jgi:arylsulfatase A-like enzyme
MGKFGNKMKNKLEYLLMMSGVISLFGCANQQTKTPNVIIVLTDDQGYGDIAANGNRWIQTPNMDRLYNESCRFTDFHVSPTSSPSRAALLTGRYNDRTGVWHTITGRSRLRENETTMAQIFAANGYKTGMFGKWHLGFTNPVRPMDKGFETAVYFDGGGIGNVPDYWDNTYFDDHYLVNGVYRQFKGYCTDVWFTEAINFIRSNKNKPFFCYLATNAPHWPYNVEDKYSDPYKNNKSIPNPNFYGMITNIDENLGKLRQELEELGIANNTILIFMSDNGTAAGITLDGHWRDGFPTDVGFNAGMRGLKSSPYEGGHRVPCFIHWPEGGLNKGVDIPELSAHIDILPTLIEICKLRTSGSLKLDGLSLFNLMKGDTSKFSNRTIIVDSQRKLHPDKWRLSSVMNRKFRLINGTELYDLRTDPGQKTDISSQHPQLVSELQQKYETWFKDVYDNWEELSYFVLGEKEQDEIMLTSHDWMDPVNTKGIAFDDEDGETRTVWNQDQVRSGLLINGHWDIDVRDEGTYLIELRRWPREADVEICNGLNASVKTVPGGKPFGPGEALIINKASIDIEGIHQSLSVTPIDKYVQFRIDLKVGKTELNTMFTNGSDISLGAYYAYIKKLN